MNVKRGERLLRVPDETAISMVRLFLAAKLATGRFTPVLGTSVMHVADKNEFDVLRAILGGSPEDVRRIVEETMIANDLLPEGATVHLYRHPHSRGGWHNIDLKRELVAV